MNIGMIIGTGLERQCPFVVLEKYGRKEKGKTPGRLHEKKNNGTFTKSLKEVTRSWEAIIPPPNSAPSEDRATEDLRFKPVTLHLQMTCDKPR